MEGMTLYSIDKAIGQIIEDGFAYDEETGEVTFEGKDLEDLRVAYSEKMKACAIWTKNQEAMAKALRDEEKRLAERRKRYEKRVERMREYLKPYVFANGGKFECPEAVMRIRKTSRVDIWDESKIPAMYTRYKVEPDKAAISKAIKGGTEVPGAVIAEYESLSVK